MAFIDVKIPSGIPKIGEWYQPYLHSSTRSFRASEAQNYSDFNLTSAVDKAETVARKIFANLLRFYKGREQELAKELGIPASKLREAKFMEDFAKNLRADLNNDTTNFPRFAKSAKTLGKMNQQTKTAIVNKIAEDHHKIFKTGFKQFLKGKPLKEFNKTEQAAIARREKDALIITYELFLDLDEWRKKNNLAIEDTVLFAFATKMVTGESVAGFEKDLKQFEEEYAKELAELERVATRLPGQVSPLIVGKENRGKVKVKQKLSSAAANPINVMHEDTIAFKLNQQVNQAMSKTFGFLVGQAKKSNKNIEVKAIVVGDKQRRRKKVEQENVFVDDVVIEITVEGKDQPILIGIDDKQYQQAGKKYKYGRGGLVKKPEELAPAIMSFNQLATYVYLTANSYFYNRALFDRLLGEPGKGSTATPELYEVINWIRSIYSLLPASPVDFSRYNSFNNIDSFVKQDTRMFVVMNDKLIPMTEFLEEVEKLAFKEDQGQKVKNTVTGLSRNFLKTLAPFKKGRFLTGELKKQKKDFLRANNAPRFWLQTEAESLQYYSKLHQQFIAPRLGSNILDQWKYQVKTEFIIK